MLVFFSFLLVLVDVKSRLAKKRDRKVPGDPVYHQKSKREGARGRGNTFMPLPRLSKSL